MDTKHVDPDLTAIRLTHGQVLWVLQAAFEWPGPPGPAFSSYVKYLRREGIPFDKTEGGHGPGINRVYHFVHVMELALALTFRSLGILKSDVVRLLAGCRGELRDAFFRAWNERDTRLGAPISLTVEGLLPIKAKGVWLDPHLRYVDSKTLSIGPLTVMGPAEALRTIAGTGRQLLFRDPINLSNIAEEVVRLAAVAPEIKRGRH